MKDLIEVDIINSNFNIVERSIKVTYEEFVFMRTMVSSYFNRDENGKHFMSYFEIPITSESEREKEKEIVMKPVRFLLYMPNSGAVQSMLGCLVAKRVLNGEKAQI